MKEYINATIITIRKKDFINVLWKGVVLVFIL